MTLTLPAAKLLDAEHAHALAITYRSAHAHVRGTEEALRDAEAFYRRRARAAHCSGGDKLSALAAATTIDNVLTARRSR